jgi:hypothetical protein
MICVRAMHVVAGWRPGELADRRWHREGKARTVQCYVGEVFAKLGIASRSQPGHVPPQRPPLLASRPLRYRLGERAWASAALAGYLAGRPAGGCEALPPAGVAQGPAELFLRLGIVGAASARLVRMLWAVRSVMSRLGAMSRSLVPGRGRCTAAPGRGWSGNSTLARSAS